MVVSDEDVPDLFAGIRMALKQFCTKYKELLGEDTVAFVLSRILSSELINAYGIAKVHKVEPELRIIAAGHSYILKPAADWAASEIQKVI